jgi:hypothetical protein
MRYAIKERVWCNDKEDFKAPTWCATLATLGVPSVVQLSKQKRPSTTTLCAFPNGLDHGGIKKIESESKPKVSAAVLVTSHKRGWQPSLSRLLRIAAVNAP